MARKTRRVKRLDFTVDAPAEIVTYMTGLADAGDGWINVIPKVSEEDQPTSLRFFTLFGGGSNGVTMCTWIPEGHDRRGQDQARLGITHVAGLRAAAQLQARDVGVPKNWTIEQDHPCRGIVLHVPSDESHERVLVWALRATAVLSPPAPIKTWQAEVYFPESS